jgi:hypothetical protein
MTTTCNNTEITIAIGVDINAKDVKDVKIDVIEYLHFFMFTKFHKKIPMRTHGDFTFSLTSLLEAALRSKPLQNFNRTGILALGSS